MEARAIKTEYRLSQWAQIVQERNASGMSINEYCKENNIVESRYFYWLKKIKEKAGQKLIINTAAKLQEVTQQTTQQAQPQSWAV